MKKYPIILLLITIFSTTTTINASKTDDKITDVTYRALNYKDWETCITDNFKNEVGEFLYITSIESFFQYMKTKSYKEAAKFVAKTTLGKFIPWISLSYIVGKTTYVGGRCTYENWE